MRLLRCQRGDVLHEDSVDASSFLFVARQCQGSEGGTPAIAAIGQISFDKQPVPRGLADRKESNGCDEVSGIK